jgi:ribosomal protein L7Ae-like RNA K-turn-binding protein
MKITPSLRVTGADRERVSEVEHVLDCFKRQQDVDRGVRPAVVGAVERSEIALIYLAKDVIIEYLRPVSGSEQ